MILGHGCRVFLSHLGNGFHIAGNVGAGSRLLAQGFGNVAHDIDHLIRTPAHFGHRVTGLRGQFNTPANLGHAGLHRFHSGLRFILNRDDHRRNLLRRFAGAFGQFSHLVGHHRKTAPLLARARGFDGSVQRQQVGLIGNFLDDFDNRGNLVGAPTQFFNGRGRGGHRTGNLTHLDDHGLHQISALRRQLAGAR